MLNFFFLVLIGLADAEAQSKKHQTQMYESEPESAKTSQFSAKVRVIREESDGVEVFFDSETQSGAFFLPKSTENFASLLKYLEESQKPKGLAVSVTADENKSIKSISKPLNKKTDLDVLSDPNFKWNPTPSGGE